MVIYIIFFSFILLLSLMNLLDENMGKDKLLSIAISLIFCLFIGMRGNGYDYYNYLSIYDLANTDYMRERIELGYLFLCHISSNYRILLLNIAFLTVLINFTFLFKVSPLPYYSLFILTCTFLLMTYMGQMRQGVAIGTVAWAIYYRDTKWKFFFFIILGSLFHISSLLAILIFFLPKKLLNWKFYFILLLISFFISEFILVFLEEFFMFSEEGIIATKLIYYNATEDFALGLNTAVIIRLIVFSLCYWRKKYIINPYFPFFLNAYFLSIILYLILGIIPQLGGRGSLYFAFLELVLVPMIIVTFKNYNRFLIASIFILLNIMRYIQFFLDDFNYSEYVSYFKDYLS